MTARVTLDEMRRQLRADWATAKRAARDRREAAANAPSVAHLDTPALVVVFELERQPRVVGADLMSAAELVRVVDWITSHGLDGLDLDAWLNRHLAYRGLPAPLPPTSDDRRPS